MNYYEVAPIKIIRIGSDSFTYSSNSPINVGAIVLIEVGKTKQVGVIINKTKKPHYHTKQVLSLITEKPLPKQLIKLAFWMSEYYLTPLALVFQTMLPRGIQKKRQNQDISIDAPERARTNILFNEEQKSAINSLSSFNNGTFLLQGVTGSGKTEIYINMAKEAIKNGKSAIILVPEISLTSQLISEFSKDFNDLIVTHSQMSEPKRHLIWLDAISSQSPRVVIGPRSALFIPLVSIGVIVVDEAHEPSYKQEQSPKYSALRVATILGRLCGCKVIFGSATPSVVDRYLAEQNDGKIIKLTKTAKINSQPPKTTIIDMTKRENFTNHRFLSNRLIRQIEDTLKINKQVLIFHNRRGSASMTLCNKCGWTAVCPNCYIPVTLHSDKNKLLCHTCGYSTKILTCCPICKNTEIIYRGIGTKLIESELRKLFPSHSVARFDADNTINDTVNNRYQELYDGKIEIIIGTQVIAKGLDLPNLRTVGVIQADTGLSMPDFNSNERAFQLLTQVIGRVGRDNNQTNVIVQSYQPNHSSIKYGLTQDYESFYADCLNERKKGKFPPFTNLLKIVCTYKTEESVIKNTKKVMVILKENTHKDVQILGPTPSFYERQNGAYRWQIVLKSPKREYLIKALSFLPKTHWQAELDPTSLL